MPERCEVVVLGLGAMATRLDIVSNITAMLCRRSD
jgi:hypothetical protein